MSRSSNLLLRVKAAFTEARQRAARIGKPVLAVVSEPAPRLDAIALFSTFDGSDTSCMLWESADKSPITLFGCGVALELTGNGDARFHEVDATWRELSAEAVVEGPVGPHMMGGFRFDVHCERSRHWSSFADASMMVPSIMMIGSMESCHIAIQVLVTADMDVDHLAQASVQRADALRTASTLPVPPAAAPTFHQDQSTDRPQWQSKVAQAIMAIERGDFQKVVLAREVIDASRNQAAPATVLKNLREMDMRAHVFAFRRGTACFLGATPERLVQVIQGRLRTQALAGSARRSLDPAVDRRVGQELLASAKNLHEHALVVDAVTRCLRPMTKDLVVAPSPELQRQSAVQHLSTPIQAALADKVGILQVVAALHPTPAVSGHPRQAALSYIRHHEGFDRGWYAGPVGWMDGDGNGDFLVALRSALLDDNERFVFAGAGIVQGSDPAAEYEETSLKMSTMRRVLQM